VQPFREERSLPGEAGLGGFVPDDVVGFLDLQIQVGLRGDHAIGRRDIQLAQLLQPAPLGLERTCDDDYSVEVCFGSRLKQEREIDAEPTTVAEGLLRACGPTGPDDWVEYVFKPLALQPFSENYFPQPGAVRSPGRVKDACAETRADGRMNLRVTRQEFMSRTIGIENLSREPRGKLPDET